MGIIPLHSCVAERVRNKLTDLLAENNSRTQVSTRFTDQVQTKEPVGKLSSGSHNEHPQSELTLHTEEDSQHLLQSNSLPSEPMETAISDQTKFSEPATQSLFRPYENKTKRLSRSTQRGERRTASLSLSREARQSSVSQQKQTVKNITYRLFCLYFVRKSRTDLCT